MPEISPKDTLARSLQSLDGRVVRPTDARNSAYLVVRAIEYMTRTCLRDQANVYLVSNQERQAAFKVLINSITRFDWSTLRLDPKVTDLVVDAELVELIVQRTVRGESLKFLEDLLYERFTAIERFGVSPESVSALRLPNYRRRSPPGTTRKSLSTTRRV